MDLIEPFQILKVCYSWWVLSSLVMIDRVHWIDKEKLTKFILNCQVTVYYTRLCHFLENCKSLDLQVLLPTLIILADWKDKENGGISDRPDNAVDIYHTYFGIAGAAFLSHTVVL